MGHSCSLFKKYIEVGLIYNVVSISALHLSHSVLYIYSNIYMLLLLIHFSLSNSARPHGL